MSRTDTSRDAARRLIDMACEGRHEAFVSADYYHGQRLEEAITAILAERDALRAEVARVKSDFDAMMEHHRATEQSYLAERTDREQAEARVRELEEALKNEILFYATSGRVSVPTLEVSRRLLTICEAQP